MGFLETLTEAAESGARTSFGKGTTKAGSNKEIERAKDLGIFVVGMSSSEDDIADWCDQLWEDQDDLIVERAREWTQALHYVENRQYITYHRDLRRWVPRKSIPWRIRSLYNIVAKAVNIRVARLTENKPSVTVQATGEDRERIEGAEFKQDMFWHNWHKLELHSRIQEARRWACKTGSGFLKFGWDSEVGIEHPATKQRVVEREIEVPIEGETGFDGQPMTRTETVVELQEFYLNRKGEEIGPVTETVDEGDEPRTVQAEIPEDTDTFFDGDVFVDVRSPFNVRWDRFTTDLWDSWYIQDSEIMPASRILSLFPDKMDVLKEAQPASSDDLAFQWQGLTLRSSGQTQATKQRRHQQGGLSDQDDRVIDVEYMVRETWIFPTDRFRRQLWGKNGAVLITVGGKLFAKRELPKWARRGEIRPYVQLVDVLEEGNHYNKTFLRDIIPLQDDVNRSRSHMSESVALAAKLLLTAPQNHQINPKVMGGLPGIMVTHRQGAEPKVMAFNPNMESALTFYQTSLEAVADLGNMNEASTGKLPSAGLAAKAIFALQFADERSITEASQAQDQALRRMAMIMDSITREEYTDERKIEIVGPDRSFVVERDIRPEDLRIDVTFHFTPGSMLQTQKEAIKNEVLTALEAGLMDPVEARRLMPSGVPEIMRRSSDLQEAKARRNIQAIVRGEETEIAPDPWDDATVQTAIMEEFMLTRRFELLDEPQKQAIVMLWQALQQQLQASAQPEQPPQGGGQPPAGDGLAIPGIGGEPGSPIPEGVERLDDQAATAQEPPPDFGQPN